MASVANDIPASAPKALGGLPVVITVFRLVSDASHAIHAEAIIDETFAFDFAIVWVQGRKIGTVIADGLRPCR